MITLKSAEQIETMRFAGKVAAKTLSFISSYAMPGNKCKDIDKKIESFIRDYGCVPACLGYKNFPASSCISVNHQVVHCIPSDYEIKPGDVVKIDLVVGYRSLFADTATTFLVPPVDPTVQKMAQSCYISLREAIKKAVPGNHVWDLSNTIAGIADQGGYGVCKQFVGHGIGADMHEEPQIPNIRLAKPGSLLTQGMVICIEPIFLTTPGANVHVEHWDTWALDGKPAVHYEHSVAITEGAPEILTLREDETYV